MRTTAAVHIVDWLWHYAFEQRASDIHLEPRRDNGVVRFRSTACCIRPIRPAAGGSHGEPDQLLARMEIVERRRPRTGASRR
jgi:general secretion pathway protein E